MYFSLMRQAVTKGVLHFLSLAGSAALQKGHHASIFQSECWISLGGWRTSSIFLAVPEFLCYNENVLYNAVIIRIWKEQGNEHNHILKCSKGIC